MHTAQRYVSTFKFDTGHFWLLLMFVS